MFAAGQFLPRVQSSKAALDKTVLPELKNRPPDTPFHQQSLKAVHFFLSPGQVWRTLCAVSIMFIALGLVVFYASESVVEVAVRYENGTEGRRMAQEYARVQGAHWEYANCTGQEVCIVNVTIETRMQAPVYVFYTLSNFYQNFLDYTTDRNLEQLRGETQTTAQLKAKCDYYVSDEETGLQYLPCGLQANSVFNDSYRMSIWRNISVDLQLPNVSSQYVEEVLPIVTTGIAWESDMRLRYKNPEDYPAACGQNYECVLPSQNTSQPPLGVEDEHFAVWMRLAAFRNFAKVYGRIESDLEVGDVVQVRIANNFPVAVFGGTKDVVLTTNSWVGGKNRVLGVSYIMFGTGVAIVWMILFVIHAFVPWLRRKRVSESGDVSHSNYTKAEIGVP